MFRFIVPPHHGSCAPGPSRPPLIHHSAPGGSASHHARGLTSGLAVRSSAPQLSRTINTNDIRWPFQLRIVTCTGFLHAETPLARRDHRDGVAEPKASIGPHASSGIRAHRSNMSRVARIVPTVPTVFSNGAQRILVLRVLIHDMETRGCVVERELGLRPVADFESIERIGAGDAPAHRLVAPFDDDVSEVAPPPPGPKVGLPRRSPRIISVA